MLKAYVGITDRSWFEFLRFHVSHRLKDDFDNGEIYYRMNGEEIWVPRDASKRPDRELLDWHADTIFPG